MIDFKINNIGDIELGTPEQYNKFKVNFSTSEYLPKFRINFKTRTPNKKRSGVFKIKFITTFGESKSKKDLQIVKDEQEVSQSIAIRLKTEFGELQDFFTDFGSELNKLRHKEDVFLTEARKNLIVSYVTKAISDIFKSNDVIINVERLEPDHGNFKLETLKITIKNKNGKLIYSYNI